MQINERSGHLTAAKSQLDEISIDLEKSNVCNGHHQPVVAKVYAVLRGRGGGRRKSAEGVRRRAGGIRVWRREERGISRRGEEGKSNRW